MRDSRYTNSTVLLEIAVKKLLLTSLVCLSSLGFATEQNDLDKNVAKAINKNPKAVEKIVARYLQNNPEAVYNALLKYQKMQQDKQHEEALSYLKDNFRTSFYSSEDGSVGNEEAPVSILVLSDRQCGYCKKAWNALEELVSKNPNKVRIVYKEMPILGAGSVQAARLAVYAQSLGKFKNIDKALVDMPTPIDLDKLKALAVKNGMNASEVDKAQTSQQVTDILQKNFLLAQKIGLQGTPMLFIANKNGSVVAPIQDFLNQEELEKTLKSFEKK